MYDSLICKYPLPEFDTEDEIFQTKDFYKNLDLYQISLGGRLRLCRLGFRSTPAIPRGGIDVDYHGDVTFYTGEAEDWHEFTARFTHGQLEWVKPSPKCPKCGKNMFHRYWGENKCWLCDIKAKIQSKNE